MVLSIPPSGDSEMGSPHANAWELLEQERRRLEAIRDGLRHDGYGTRPFHDTIFPAGSPGLHHADSATDTFEEEVGLTILADVEAEIVEVDRAKQRLDDGTYGACVACGAPIPSERLAAVAATRFCLRHEEQWEVAGAYREDSANSTVLLTTEFLSVDDNGAATDAVGRFPEDNAMRIWRDVDLATADDTDNGGRPQ